MPFFEDSEVIRKPPPSLIPQCGRCGLYKGCKSPKMPVSGDGRKGVLIVAEAPGAEEDRRNEQLIGDAGQELRRTLRGIGIDLDRDCWKTNSIICRPPDNRTPTNDEVDYCRPNLTDAIKRLGPKVIIPMGGPAIRSVLGPHWRDDVGKVGTWVGWHIPLHRPNVWVAPTYHPSYVMRELKDNNPIGPVLKLWFSRHLEAAFSLKTLPWDDPPDYESKVRSESDPARAARWIESVVERGGPTAFDYETNMLKPDSTESEIVSCAICWRGKETVAFPWAGDVIPAMSSYLRSPNSKIGSNCKFEERWTRAKLGHGVNGWVWDCMQSAHHLDCREGITSVKFQAFVRTGQGPWDLAARPYLVADGGNTKNKIRKLDQRSLLLYNGLDSLMEYHIGCLQRAVMLQQDPEPIRLASAK